MSGRAHNPVRGREPLRLWKRSMKIPVQNHRLGITRCWLLIAWLENVKHNVPPQSYLNVRCMLAGPQLQDPNDPKRVKMHFLEATLLT